MTTKTSNLWERDFKVFYDNARPVDAGWAITFFLKLKY